MKTKKILYVFSFVFLFHLMAAEYAFSKPTKRVLVVHSYSSKYQWVSTISRGIHTYFSKHKDIQVEILHMDTKNASLEQKQQAGAKVRESIASWKPDVVILADDNAQEYVGRFYINKMSPYIVFCGVNKELSDYGYDKALNVTGVLERPPFLETIELFRKLNPEAKKFAVITDYSPTSNGAMKQLKAEAAKTDYEMICFSMVKTFPEWKKEVLSYQGKCDAILVYLYYTVKTKTGSEQNLEPREVMQWMVSNSKTPVIGTNNFAVDDGALCGVGQSALEQGKEAARMAMALLKGEDIENIPVIVPKRGIRSLDVAQLKAKGFSIDEETKAGIDVLLGDRK